MLLEVEGEAFDKVPVHLSAIKMQMKEKMHTTHRKVPGWELN